MDELSAKHGISRSLCSAITAAPADPAIRELVVRARREGSTLEAIARIHKIPLKRVRRICQTAFVIGALSEAQFIPKPDHSDRNAQIVAARQAGATFAVLSRTHNLTPQQVGRICRTAIDVSVETQHTALAALERRNAALVGDRAAGFSFLAISVKYGVTYGHARKIYLQAVQNGSHTETTLRLR